MDGHIPRIIAGYTEGYMSDKFFFFDPKWVVQSIIIGLWLSVAVVIFIHENKDNKRNTPVPQVLFSPVISEIKAGQEFSVSKVTVIRGDYFDLTLKEDNLRLFGKLNVIATEAAKIKLLELLNTTTKPKIVLREKQTNGCWIIDFFVTDKDKEINLVEWLSSNNLVYK